jgi:hypothetical protein
MSKPLDRELASNLVIATNTPVRNAGAGRRGFGHRPARENPVRTLEPGPTSGRAEAMPFSVAELRTTATLERRWDSSL